MPFSALPPPLRAGVALALAALAVPRASAREAWTRLDGDNFTILSPDSQREIRSWAVEFEEFRSGIGKFLRTDDKALQPVTVVLFSSEHQMRAYKTLEKGRPTDVDGLFMRSPMGNFIEATTEAEDDRTRRLIFHEGVHWLTNTSDTPLPLWLNEGLAEVFSTFSTEDNLYAYGQMIPNHVVLLRREAMMPIKELIAIQPGSLLYNEGTRTSIFYAESWAFVHYLLFSGTGEERSRFNQLVRELRPGVDPDAVFKSIFGVDCAGMDVRLADYLRHGSFVINRIRFDRRQVEQDLKARPALPAEVELAESCLLAAVDRPDEALPRLRRLTAAAPAGPTAWEAEGYAAYEEQLYGEAETCFAQAAAHDSRNYFVYSYLGDAALGLRPSYVGGPSTPTGAAASDARQATDYYERELALNALDRHAYDNIAASANTLDRLSPLDVKILRQGAYIYPEDLQIRVGVAVAALHGGDGATGLADLRRIAAARLPVNQDAARYAQAILDERQRQVDHDQLDRLWQAQDFAGAVALTDRMLAAETNAAYRIQLETVRASAMVALESKTDHDQVNRLWNAQDFAGLIAVTDRLLAGETDPANRAQLETVRAKATIALKVKQGVDRENAGDLDGAKQLLQEAEAGATDAATRARIQALLGGIAARKAVQQ